MDLVLLRPLLLIVSLHFAVCTRCKEWRPVFTAPAGMIRSQDTAKYGENWHCEWYIKGDPGSTITLQFKTFHTECGYDFVTVFDGDSHQSPKLAHLSGKHNDLKVTSTSNKVLLFMHSDKNVASEGFVLDYSITLCPDNCSGHGTCHNGTCICDALRYGPTCSYGSICDTANRRCVCTSNDFIGETCAVPITPNTGIGRWFTVSQWSQVFSPCSGHIALKINDRLFVYGGFTLSAISGDLQAYNFTSNLWIKILTNSRKPAARYHHAGDVTSDGFVMFGGRVNIPVHALSNELWRYELSTNTWTLLSDDKRVPPLAGHTLTVVKQKVYIFGGSNGVLVSSSMYVFDLVSNTWEEHQPSPGLRVKLRLFGHTATYYQQQNVIVVYGGIIRMANWHNGLASKEIFAYHVSSSTWVSWGISKQGIAFHTAVILNNHLVIHGGLSFHNECSPSENTLFYNLNCHTWSTQPNLIKNEKARRYSHAAVTYNAQSMLVIGGYNGGEVLNDILASKVAPQESSDECRHTCSMYKDCEDCTTNEDCDWCTLSRTCQKRDTNMCRQSRMLWWGTNDGELLKQPQECQTRDLPPGITMLRHKKPVDIEYPDGVEIGNKSKFLFEIKTEEKVFLKGKVYPYFRHNDVLATNHKVRLVGQRADANLNIWADYMHTEKTFVNFSEGVAYSEISDTRPFRLFNASQRYKTNTWWNIYVQATIRRTAHLTRARVEVQWNTTDHTSFEPIPRDYLEPLSFTNCSRWTTCMACIASMLCGWCDLTQTCQLTHVQCVKGIASELLVRTQDKCLVCSHHYDCQTCEADVFCHMKTTKGDQSCTRQLKSKKPKDLNGICLTPCHNLTTAKACLDKSLRCLWCDRSATCLPYAQSLLQNTYGECNTVYDKHWGGRLDGDCELETSCDQCLSEDVSHKCGWCHDEQDPRIGKCVTGDFAGAKLPCNINTTLPSKTKWSYTSCPDVDECTLNISNCKNNSHCVNNHGSFDCVCDQGYEGDGKTLCERTCWPPCVHGTCNTTTYTCECSLGWTGVNCSTDCGCHGHSTCKTGVDLCDSCQDNTHGGNCELCVQSSYGNATDRAVGCTPCQCNGHGDPSRYHCHPTTGECYCLHHTARSQCNLCEDGFQGNPENSGVCYLPCANFSILSNHTSGYLSPASKGYNSEPRTCVWILASRALTHNEYIYAQPVNFQERFSVKLLHSNRSCFDSRMTVYDGISPNPRTHKVFLHSSFKRLGSFCGANSGANFLTTTGMVSIVYEGLTVPDSFTHNTAQFLVEFSRLKCPDACPAPYICNTKGVCACPDGFTGGACEHKKCPNDCNSDKGHGTCVKASCQCKAGFTKADCSGFESADKWRMFNVPLSTTVGLTDTRRFGGTMEVMGANHLYVIGGRSLKGLATPFLVLIDLSTSSRNTVVVSEGPSERFFHCSFTYMNDIYVYGGINSTGHTSEEIWRFRASNNSWLDVTKDLGNKQKLAGHSCTRVNDKVYVIGGRDPQHGYNEYIRVLLLNPRSSYYQKFSSSLTPSAFYSHVAVYHAGEKKIYIHGGMAFYKEKFHLSDRVFMFDVAGKTWNHIDARPQQQNPSLMGHAALLIKDILYLVGGYSDPHGFNADIFTWKIKCNHWTKIPNALMVQSGGRADPALMFPLYASYGEHIYLYGGFNTADQNALVEFEPPADVCRHHDSITCAEELGCSWCVNSSYCFDPAVTSMCGLQSYTACTVDVKRECDSFTSCTTCLSTYPKHTGCSWCGAEGKCKDETEEKCNKKFDKIGMCFENECEAASCSNCENSRCIWTYWLSYSHYWLLDYGANFPWNCFRKSAKESEIVKNDVAKLRSINVSTRACPKPCESFTSCHDCLDKPVRGDFGGSRTCYWSEKLEICMSESLLPMNCSYGACGALLNNNNQSHKCARSCKSRSSCLDCTSLDQCGWCSTNNQGGGKCMEGDIQGPREQQCGVNGQQEGPVVVDPHNVNTTWSYHVCPLENECSYLGSSACEENHVCRDKVIGYECVCASGYKRENEHEWSSRCVPVCEFCGNGKCIAPHKCVCLFGWTGENCTTACQCNGFSDCANATHPHVCTDCRQQTMGAQCEKCKPLYVGNPPSRCMSCSEACHHNTQYCVSKKDYDQLNVTLTNEEIVARLIWGPVNEDVKCLACQEGSEGDKCETCKDGYFRSNGDCKKCNCNGHGDTCDKYTGEGCECMHNTQSDPACKQNCYNRQCSHCNASYKGSSVDGRQCYLYLTPEIYPRYKTLSVDRTDFFVASPNYTNVNIRIFVDVYEGELDVYFSDAHQDFVVYENTTTHRQNISMGENSRRQRRSIERDVQQHTVPLDRIAEFIDYTGEIVVIARVRKRLVISIKHAAHNLNSKLFYIGVSTVGKSKTASFHVYYRQDFPRINLTLFFLVLVVCLLIIIGLFILAWNARHVYLNERRRQAEDGIQISMANRAFATYTLLIEDRNDKNANGSGERTVKSSPSLDGGHHNNEKRKKRKNVSFARVVEPLASQNTEDNIASVVTVIIEHPVNDFTECRYVLGTGLVYANNQQLVHVRTSQHGPQGRTVNTRILTTAA